ncbi:MAG: response regulator [Elusimicrobiota bacterium]
MSQDSPAKVLVVEDDPTVLRLTESALSREGYQVLAAATADAGRRGFAELRPDLALLDVELPDGNGVELCGEMRARDDGSMPILFLTAHNEIADRLRGFAAGANDYILKPFSFDELTARVRVHLATKQSGDTLVRENRKLELRERTRRELADMIVHDLKTPLTSIRGTLSIIRECGLIHDAQTVRLLQMSEGATEMMSLMINDILDLSRFENGGVEPKLEDITAAGLFERLVRLFEPQCMRHKVDLRTAVRPNDLAFRSDYMLLFRMLANITANAVQHSLRTGGSEIIIEAARENGRVRLAVLDRGPGVPDADKKRIFEKFVRLEPAADPMEKTGGIGLAFCRLAAEALGAKIWVEDREGGGSRFTIELPAEKS